MARRFTGTDTITCAVGNANTTRAGTVILLIRAYDADFDALSRFTDLISGLAGTSLVWGLFLDNSVIFNNEFGSGLAGPSDKDTWYVIACTKASGNAAFHYHLAPVGGSWTHGTSGNATDGSGVDSIVFGAGVVEGAGKFEIAAAATYSAALSDSAVEALGTTSMADWMDATPTAAWQFNQTATTDDVTDLTSGGADQTAISGTTVTDDPAGWTYFSGEAETAEGTADVALNLGVAATGARDSSGTANVGLAYTVAAAGEAAANGTADVGLGYAAAAAGSTDHTGTADVGLAFTVAATGATDYSGTADVSLVFTVAATSVQPGTVSIRPTAAPAVTFRTTAAPRVKMEVGNA